MQKFLDIAYQNVECLEQIVTDVFVIALGFGVPIVVVIFCVLGLLGCIFLAWEKFKEKVALLDNGDITSSNE